MRSTLPKVLHPLCGRPLIDFCVEAVKKTGVRQVLVVTARGGHNRTTDHFKTLSNIKIIHQSRPLGTGHAVAACAPALKGFKGYVLITYGDCPLIRAETLKKFIRAVLEKGAALGFITGNLACPAGYGRVVRSTMEDVERIVEEKEATLEEKQITEVNTGFYCVKNGWLSQALENLKPHPVTREYYLTDIVEMAIQQGEPVLGYRNGGMEDFLGINTQKQLAMAARVMRDRLADFWMEQGVVFADPWHTYLDADVQIGKGTVIHPQVHLRGKTRIGRGCVIDAGSVLRDMTVADGVVIKPYSVLEESVVEKEAQVGPFSRVRPHSRIGAGARIGNFVELKKTTLKKGVKANHLAYLGDAVVGEGTNVGCGTITCNYDGVKKHPTRIGKRVFVGSDVQFVAPIRVGDGAYIGAGSTITDNVPPRALAIARGRQVVKKGWAMKRSKIRYQKSK